MSIVTITLEPDHRQDAVSVQRVVPERKLQGRDVSCFPGGGGINVARVAWRLGADVSAGAAAVMTAGTELCRVEDLARLVERMRETDPGG